MPAAYQYFNLTIFFPVILTLGIASSIQDFNSAKVSNRWITACCGYIFFIYLGFWMINLLALRTGSKSLFYEYTATLYNNLDKWLINYILSFMVGFFLWYKKFWGAGDAKLFACYSALTPPIQNPNAYFCGFFPSFKLLIMTFVPATIFILIISILSQIKQLLNFIRLGSAMPFLKNVKKNFFRIIAKNLKLFFIFQSTILLFTLFNNEISACIRNVNISDDLLLVFLLLFNNRLLNILKEKFGYVFIIFATLIVVKSILLAPSIGDYLRYLADSVIRSFFMVIFFQIFKKITNEYYAATKEKMMPFAPWLFIGIILTWFLR